MKMEIVRSQERGTTKTNWLYSRHSFSFGNYYDPQRTGFGALIVLNDDVIEPGQGFGMHSHDNMEIITIVLEGVLEHKDSLGNGGLLRPGEVQHMSAGSGIVHSEFNSSKTEKVHLLQIWILPNEENILPKYEQKKIDLKKNVLNVIASSSKTTGGLLMHQSAAMLMGEFDAGKKIIYNPLEESGTFVFLIDGQAKIGVKTLNEADAAEITNANKIEIEFSENSNILLIEVPMSQ